MAHIIKRNWTRITSGRLYDLYVEVVLEAKRVGEIGPAFEWPYLFTRKSYSVLGTCYTRHNPDGTCSSSIVISEGLLAASDDSIRTVLIHELAHAVEPRDHHGYCWSRVARRVGARWNIKPSRLCHDKEAIAAIEALAPTKKSVYKYELYCPCCGATWKYRSYCKAVQRPSAYRCKIDHTPLKSRAL